MTDEDKDELLYDAWCVIANASDWNALPVDGFATKWRESAERWRDKWHETLDVAKCEFGPDPRYPHSHDGRARWQLVGGDGWRLKLCDAHVVPSMSLYGKNTLELIDKPEEEWHNHDCGVTGGFPHSSLVCKGPRRNWS